MSQWSELRDPLSLARKYLALRQISARSILAEGLQSLAIGLGGFLCQDLFSPILLILRLAKIGRAVTSFYF